MSMFIPGYVGERMPNFDSRLDPPEDQPGYDMNQHGNAPRARRLTYRDRKSFGPCHPCAARKTLAVAYHRIGTVPDHVDLCDACNRARAFGNK